MACGARPAVSKSWPARRKRHGRPRRDNLKGRARAARVPGPRPFEINNPEKEKKKTPSPFFFQPAIFITVTRASTACLTPAWPGRPSTSSSTRDWPGARLATASLCRSDRAGGEPVPFSSRVPRPAGRAGSPSWQPEQAARTGSSTRNKRRVLISRCRLVCPGALEPRRGRGSTSKASITGAAGTPPPGRRRALHHGAESSPAAGPPGPGLDDADYHGHGIVPRWRPPSRPPRPWPRPSPGPFRKGMDGAHLEAGGPRGTWRGPGGLEGCR